MPVEDCGPAWLAKCIVSAGHTPSTHMTEQAEAQDIAIANITTRICAHTRFAHLMELVG